MFEFIGLLILGMVAGTLAGLLGVGGGGVIVPALVFLLHDHPQIPPEHLMHIALGTSLATIVLTSLSSIYAHNKRGAVKWQIVTQLTGGIIVGALLGAAVAASLSSRMLSIIFGIFLLLLSLELGFGKKPAPHRQLPNAWATSGVGGIIGVISSLVGIGGGSLTVPFLAYCNIPLQNAIATSAACGFPIAVSGAIGFIISGWGVAGLPPASLGFVYLPAFITIAATSLFFAPLGVKLAHSLPTLLLKRIFAAVLALVGLKMLLG